MIGLAVYAAILAYGRISKSFGLLHWMILLLVTLVTCFLQLAIMPGKIGPAPLFLAVLVQLAILVAIYVAGALAGRWLDRDKYPD